MTRAWTSVQAPFFSELFVFHLEKSDADLADVELAGETGLHWGNLDVDFTIKGLMAGVFGTAGFMDAARRGGQSRSAAKAAAARANGAKGGRPVKRRQVS